MTQERAFITGLGVISAAGMDLAETLSSLAEGRRAPAPPTLFETPLASPVFEVLGLRHPASERGRRTFHLAMAAVRQALDDAQLEAGFPGLRVGVALGTTVACQLNDLEWYRSYRTNRSAPMDAVDRYLNGNLGASVAAAVGAEGPCITVANACSSSSDALGVGLSWMRAGLCDVVLAGGADELNRVPQAGFHSLSVFSPEPCRPFDRDRKGLNLGEGAGILVLERESLVRPRGARPYAAFRGYGSGADAYHLTAPRPDGSGLEAAIRRALQEAEIQPDEVAFVNAHGTATKDNDGVEGNALHRVFGPSIKFLSTKGYTGHTLGAAGGLEAALTVAGLKEGWIPKNVGFENPDEAIPIAPVRERSEIRGRFALSTSLAFGGSNAAVIFERIEREEGGRG